MYEIDISCLLYVDYFMYATHVRFQMHFLSEELITKRATKLGWNIVTTHCMTLQMMFEFESTGAVLANELWLYPALIFQMTG